MECAVSCALLYFWFFLFKSILKKFQDGSRRQVSVRFLGKSIIIAHKKSYRCKNERKKRGYILSFTKKDSFEIVWHIAFDVFGRCYVIKLLNEFRRAVSASNWDVLRNDWCENWILQIYQKLSCRVLRLSMPSLSLGLSTHALTPEMYSFVT